MDVTPLPGAPFGAVVTDADLDAHLTSSMIDTIWSALDTYLVLVFRGHTSPSPERFLTFGRHFGHIPKTGLTTGAHPEHNEILMVSNISENGRKLGVGDAEWMGWHTDYSFRPRVSQIGFLEALEVPISGGGQTLFTDTYSIYETLPATLQERLGHCRARHALRTGYERTIAQKLQREVSLGASNERIEPEDGTSTIHPLIARNPRTGRQSIYVSTLNTDRIVDLPDKEGAQLLDDLLDRIGRPEYTYAHQWRPGDLVMWDQLGTVHAKQPFDPSERRIMRQVVSIFDEPDAPWRTEPAA